MTNLMLWLAAAGAALLSLAGLAVTFVIGAILRKLIGDEGKERVIDLPEKAVGRALMLVRDTDRSMFRQRWLPHAQTLKADAVRYSFTVLLKSLWFLLRVHLDAIRLRRLNGSPAAGTRTPRAASAVAPALKTEINASSRQLPEQGTVAPIRPVPDSIYSPDWVWVRTGMGDKSDTELNQAMLTHKQYKAFLAQKRLQAASSQ